MLLACHAAGLALSPTRRHAPGAARWCGLADAGRMSPPARDDLCTKYVRTQRPHAAPGAAGEGHRRGRGRRADTFLYRQRGASGGRKGWDFHVFVVAGTDVWPSSSLPWPTPGPAWVEGALRPGAGRGGSASSAATSASRADRGPGRQFSDRVCVALSPKGRWLLPARAFHRRRLGGAIT